VLIFLKNILSVRKMAVFLSPSAPAKPPNNAQIGGAFYFFLMKVNYNKRCTLPQDLIPMLKSRGLSIPAKFPTVDVKAMGFPANWQAEPLWR